MFIAGYIYKNTVSIVADSAVTSLNSMFNSEFKPPSNSITTFGDLFHFGNVYSGAGL